jgi:quinone-modifying oxidoreductase subunit QmoA
MTPPRSTTSASANTQYHHQHDDGALAAPNGPTRARSCGRPTTRAPESVAFVQCAGSRDENHLPYCSYICCMASLKQATYVREQYPDAKIYIFYIDIRAPGSL